MKIISMSRFKDFSIFSFTSFLLYTGTVFSQGLSEDLHLLQPTEIAYPDDDGVEVGAGWDLLWGGKTNSTCMEFTKITLQKTSYKWDFEEIENDSDIKNTEYGKLYGNMEWGIASSSASLEDNKKRSLHQDSISTVSTLVVETGSTQIKSLRSLSEEDEGLSEKERATINRGSTLKFSKKVRDVLKNDNYTKEKKRAWFREKCGTGYIATVKRGVVVSILKRRLVKKSSVTDQSEGEAKLSINLGNKKTTEEGTVPALGIEVGGGTDKTEETNNQNSEITIGIRQRGGSTIIPVTLTDTRSKVETALKKDLEDANVHNTSAEISAVVMPYTRVPGSDPYLVASQFAMKKHSALYYFMEDTLKGYNNASEYLHSKRYPDNKEKSEAPFSPLSLAVSGGEKEVRKRQEKLQQYIGALLSVIRECRYLSRSYAILNSDTKECSIEDSLASAKAKDVKYVEYSELDFSIQSLIETLYKYTAGLPLSNEDLSVKTAASFLEIHGWKIWSDTVQENYKKTNKERLLGYIRDRVFDLRLDPLREELCELGEFSDFCSSPEILKLIPEEDDFKITHSLFPEAEYKKPPSQRKRLNLTTYKSDYFCMSTRDFACP